MKDKIFHFLENNLIGKELVTDAVVYTLANGKLEGIYNDQMIFSNLVRTANGFKFNMTTITHELIYNLVIFNGKELSWRENQLLYRDNPIEEDKYKPVAFDSKVRIYLNEGKVVYEYLPTLWDVNPRTLEKRLSKDDYPPYISKEV